MWSRSLIALGIYLAVSASSSLGQSPSIPQSPAFTYLELSPTRVEHPTAARTFGAALVNGIDWQGKVQQGLAIDAAPWTWIPGVSIPADEYGHLGKYALANLSLSFGTTRAAGDSASSSVAIGLRTTLFDRSDPMADPAFVSMLRAATRDNSSIPSSSADPSWADPNLSDAEVHDRAAEINRRLREEWLASHTNGASLSVAAATGVFLDQSRISNGKWTGLSGWTSLALPLTRHGQIMAQGRADHHAAIDSLRSWTAARLGGRVVYGTPDTDVFLEAEWNSKPAPGTGATTLWCGGVEFRAAKDLWLSAGLGKGYEPGERDRIVTLTNIRWRVGEKRELAKVKVEP